MTDKRSYTNFLDKSEFPFEILDNKINFTILYSKINNSNKTRFWKIYCLLKNNKENINITNDLIDINLFKNLNKKKFKNLYIYRIWYYQWKDNNN